MINKQYEVHNSSRTRKYAPLYQGNMSISFRFRRHGPGLRLGPWAVTVVSAWQPRNINQKLYSSDVGVILKWILKE
jgi:hypothetical protein